jgi:hypothetical protein
MPTGALRVQVAIEEDTVIEADAFIGAAAVASVDIPARPFDGTS